jgi:hypothetical protein
MTTIASADAAFLSTKQSLTIVVDWLIETRGRWRTSVAAYARCLQVWLFAARVGVYTLGRDLQPNDDL